MSEDKHSASVTVEAGQVFAGRYEVEKLLGKGAMGAVYRAVDQELGVAVALKVMSPSFAQQPSAADRFRREVRLARKVTHQNVARTHDLGQEDGHLFLTMELIEGEALDEILARRRRLPASEALDIVQQVTQGLIAAHEVGVVHRDLKPGNIMIEPGGRAVITDFGIARPTHEDANDKTMGAIGTPSYMAPEQCDSRPIDGRTDLYALGGILFEMLTGRLPFLEATPLATALARLNEEPPDPRTYQPMPDTLADLVLRLLARAPDDRPQSARQLALLLREIDGGDETIIASGSSSLTPVFPTTGGRSGSLPSVSRLEAWEGLAVLPFTYRGPADEAFVASSLTEELIDVLSMIRGLRVFASAATMQFSDNRDPRHVCATLGAASVVDGTVQKSGPRVRITARLINQAGEQLWSERFDGQYEDVFALQETMSRRIAETLRLTIRISGRAEVVPPAAAEHYLMARARLSVGDVLGDHGALWHIEQSLSLAPEFKPALAVYALACARAWFFSTLDPTGNDWRAQAEEAVTRALEHAEEIPESHLAAAMLAMQKGEFKRVVEQAQAALTRAPTFASALEYLGAMECEAGRPEQGARRIFAAWELDPTLLMGPIMVGRNLALDDDWDSYHAVIERMRKETDHTGLTSLEVRAASWRGDEEFLLKTLDGLSTVGDPRGQLNRLYAELILGRMPVEQALVMVQAVTVGASPRFFALLGQLIAEVACVQGHTDIALDYLGQAADGQLIDIVWFDRCRLLEPIRSTPAFASARDKVLGRAEALWLRPGGR